MRLQTTFDIRAWYDAVRSAKNPVAWCSAFAPAEILVAMGITPVYPENHAAMLGALAPERDHDQPFARAAIAAAEAHGLSTPRLCAYALADLGVLTGGAPSPIGELPLPDVFYACDSQCAVVARWGAAVQTHFAAQPATQQRHIPHHILHAPPLRGEQHTAAELAAFKTQLLLHVAALEKQFATRLDSARLAAVVAESHAANSAWQRCLELGKVQPAPWTSFDAFTAMAPIVIARGTPLATEFYLRLERELRARVAAGFAAVPGERRRLVWDAIPIWPRKNWLADFFAQRQVAMVASTYTHSWWFDFSGRDPLDALVKRYAWNTMNRSGAWVLNWTTDIVRDFSADGIISHWNQSCGIWNSYVKRRLPGFAAAGIPCHVINADMVDARAFDESAVSSGLEKFLQTR